MRKAMRRTSAHRLIENLREYLADLRDEREWDELVRRTQPQLVAAARRVKREIAAGLVQPLDLD
jgi:hypothetical protein